MNCPCGQSRRLREIGRRIMRAIDPDGPCVHDEPISAVASKLSYQSLS
jgi:hypothetical protein